MSIRATKQQSKRAQKRAGERSKRLMTRQVAPDSIEQLRAMIDPDTYINQLQETKKRLLQQAASLLQDLDLSNASERVPDSDKERLSDQLNNVLEDIMERITLIDARVEEFKQDRARATRPFKKSVKSKAKLAKEVQDTEADSDSREDQG